MCPESQLFLKKILPNFRIFLSQIFVQFAEKIFYAICRKKFLCKLHKKNFAQFRDIFPSDLCTICLLTKVERDGIMEKHAGPNADAPRIEKRPI